MARKAQDIRAFATACPHQYPPLDHNGDKLISAVDLPARIGSAAAETITNDGGV